MVLVAVENMGLVLILSRVERVLLGRETMVVTGFFVVAVQLVVVVVLVL